MSRGAITVNSSHEEIALLLPWYVNGSLAGGQKTLVDEHVRNCMVCRRELVAERRILDIFLKESPADQSVRAGFERLHLRIAASKKSPRPRHPPEGALGLAWTAVQDMVRLFRGANLRTALIAAPLFIIAIVLGLTSFPQEQVPVSSKHGLTNVVDAYQTLSNPIVDVANPDDLQVIFSRDTSEEAIEGILKSLPAIIVGGPSTAGVYTVRLSGLSGEGKIQAALRTLRGRPEVFFAEASQPQSVSTQGEAQSK